MRRILHRFRPNLCKLRVKLLLQLLPTVYANLCERKLRKLQPNDMAFIYVPCAIYLGICISLLHRGAAVAVNTKRFDFRVLFPCIFPYANQDLGWVPRNVETDLNGNTWALRRSKLQGKMKYAIQTNWPNINTDFRDFYIAFCLWHFCWEFCFWYFYLIFVDILYYKQRRYRVSQLK